MVPTSLPMIRLFRMTSGSSTRSRARVLAVFLSGYALVWALFGFAALGGDVLLHRFEDSLRMVVGATLADSSSVLALAGLSSSRVSRIAA